MLLILQDLNKGALISAQSSSNATVLDNEDKVCKITGGVVDLQLKLNCYSIELCTYLSIYSTQLSVIEYIVMYTANFTVIAVLRRISLSALRKS